MSGKIYVASNDNPNFTPSRSWFVSLDGDSWLGVAAMEGGEITSEGLKAAPIDEIRKMFAGNGKTRPMTMARRFLASMIGGTTTFYGDASES